MKGRESREFMIQLLERLEQRLNDREQATDIEEEEEDFISCKEHGDLNQLEDRLKERKIYHYDKGWWARIFYFYYAIFLLIVIFFYKKKIIHY